MHSRSESFCFASQQQTQPMQLARVLQYCTTTTILLILGIALPWFAHRFGFGKAFLPMHLPLLMGGFLLPIGYAISLALMIPIANTALLGMPTLFPALPMIIVELLIYIVTIKYFYQVKRYNIIVSLLLSLFFGRVTAAIIALIFGSYIHAGFNTIGAYFLHLTVDFLPGLALQLLIVPILAPWLLSHFSKNN